MSARQDRNVDEADLEALRDFYATLGPGLPLEFARVFAGDGSPAGEHWYARLQRGRGLVMTLSRKSRLSSDAITPHDLFLLPPTWELTRAVLSDLTGESSGRGNLFSARGNYFCRPRGSWETDSLPFVHLWTMCGGRALRFDSFLDGLHPQRAATLAGCPARF
jgi:hypothetical protein